MMMQTMRTVIVFGASHQTVETVLYGVPLVDKMIRVPEFHGGNHSAVRLECGSFLRALQNMLVRHRYVS